MNTGLSYIQQPHYNTHPYFGHVDCAEVREECRKHQIPFESMRYFVPFVCVVWFNDKGRFALSVQHETPLRQPRPEEWKTPPLNEMEMLDHIRHNGVTKGTNIFSGHNPDIQESGSHNVRVSTTISDTTFCCTRPPRTILLASNIVIIVP